jgi:hypothetical protein
MGKQLKILGNLVAHCEILQDDLGEWGYFFVFPDLCCRWSGHYTLRFVVNQMFPFLRINF